MNLKRRTRLLLETFRLRREAYLPRQRMAERQDTAARYWEARRQGEWPWEMATHEIAVASYRRYLRDMVPTVAARGVTVK